MRRRLSTLRARLLLAGAMLVAVGGAASIAASDLGADANRDYRTPDELQALLAEAGGRVVVDREGNPILGPDGKPLRVAPDGRTLLDSQGRPLRDARGRVLKLGEDGTLPEGLREGSPRSGPPRGRGPKKPGPGAPGSGEPIVVGVAYDNAQKLDEVYARYGGNARASDGGLDSRAVADHINSTGGIGGRKLELRLREYDTTDGRPYDVTFAEVCQWFAEGKRPLAVIALGKDDELAPCLKSKGIPLISDWPSAGSTVFHARFPTFFFQPGSLGLDRFAIPYVRGLKEQRFFSGNVRVGLVRYSDADYDAAANRALKPALAAAGVRLTAEEAIPVTTSVNDIGGLLTRVSSAVVRFRSLGVNRIVSIDNTGQVVGLFAQAAGPQGYYPRYGFSSQNSPLFIRSSLSPRDVRGSVGIGWSPLTDVAAEQEGPVPATRATCASIFERAGIQRLGNRTAYGQFGAHSRCSNLLMLRAALEDHDASTPAELAAAIDALGGRFQSAITMETRLGGARHDGAAGYRFLRFDDRCACFVYEGPVRSLG